MTNKQLTHLFNLAHGTSLSQSDREVIRAAYDALTSPDEPPDGIRRMIEGKQAMSDPVLGKAIAEAGYLGEPEVVQDVERWQRELKTAGWKEERFDLWRSPGGLLYRGPYKAWQVMMGHI